MFNNLVSATSCHIVEYGLWTIYLYLAYPLPSTPGVQVSEAPWQEFGREQKGSTSAKDQGKFVPSEKVIQLQKKLMKFIEDHIYPMEGEFYEHAQSTSRWTIHPEEEKLKALAKMEGLWNLFIPVYILPFKPFIFT
jgi:acyl-CoA dehydrogenase